MNIKKLLDFADNFGVECGAFQNLHPDTSSELGKSARKYMAKRLEGYVLVPVQLIQNIDDLTESGFDAEEQIDELCDLIKEAKP